MNFILDSQNLFWLQIISVFLRKISWRCSYADLHKKRYQLLHMTLPAWPDLLHREFACKFVWFNTALLKAFLVHEKAKSPIYWCTFIKFFIQTNIWSYNILFSGEFSTNFVIFHKYFYVHLRHFSKYPEIT